MALKSNEICVHSNSTKGKGVWPARTRMTLSTSCICHLLHTPNEINNNAYSNDALWATLNCEINIAYVHIYTGISISETSRCVFQGHWALTPEPSYWYWLCMSFVTILERVVVVTIFVLVIVSKRCRGELTLWGDFNF